MNMLDVQRRHATVFRIRFGEKDGNRPVKLTDAIRVTSANPEVVDAFVDVYGGERRAWNGQWEAKLPTTSLRIRVLPGQSISQWWERYRGSVCERRCPGTGGIETKSGKPCWCDPDVEKRTANRDDCSPTTRVSVICPDVAVIGSGMFVCHGLVGAETLPQSIAIAETAPSRGLMVPAVLRVVEFKGRTHFIVPQIEVIGISLNELAAAQGETPMLPHATRSEISPGSGPVPVLAAAPAPPIAEQMSAMDRPYVPAGRANAAEPIRPTGLSPRTAAQANGGGVGVLDAEVVDVSAHVDGGEVSDGVSSAPTDVPSDAPRTVNRVAIAAREAGLDDDGRHELCRWASLGRVGSSKQLTAAEQGLAVDAARRIKDGTAKLIASDDGGGLVLRDVRFGWPAVIPDEDGTPQFVPLDELRAKLREQLELLGDAGKAGWKAAGLPALARLGEEHRELALTTVWHLQGEPF